MSPEGKTHSQCTVNRHDAVSKCDAVDRQGAVSTADAVNRPGAVQSFAAVQLDRPHANSVASKAAADGSVQHYRSSDDSSSNSDSHSSLTASSAEEGKAASVASHLLRPCTKPVMTQQTEVYKEAKMSCNPHVRLEVHSLHHSDQVPEAQQEGLFESQRAEHGCDVSQAGLGHASVHVVQVKQQQMYNLQSQVVLVYKSYR